MLSANEALGPPVSPASPRGGISGAPPALTAISPSRSHHPVGTSTSFRGANDRENVREDQHGSVWDEDSWVPRPEPVLRLDVIPHGVGTEGRFSLDHSARSAPRQCSAQDDGFGVKNRDRHGAGLGNHLGGGRIFTSLSRRRGGDMSRRRDHRGRNPMMLQTYVSEGRSRDHGHAWTTSAIAGEVSGRVGGGRKGRAWMRPRRAPTPVTSNGFFGEGASDDGRGWSESSNDDGSDGPSSRKSYIQVGCNARTSYKLFSSDPQVGTFRLSGSWSSPKQRSFLRLLVRLRPLRRPRRWR